MAKLILTPPVVFVMVLLVSWLLLRLLSRLSFRPAKETESSGKSYACGEDNYDNTAQPDYSSFFAFAFFFTLAHVATLIITTVPQVNLKVFAIAVFYIIGAGVGLYVLFRR
jgi:NADH:ubiquinone oxidoreductase subunit 3 (subunit A)